MSSATSALLWQIWRQHRSTIAVIVVMTVAGRVVDVLEAGSGDPSDSSPLTVMLAMMAFLLLLTVFNVTEAGGDQGLGRFPRRLFTLPVTTLRLVTVPTLAGIAAIEVLYLLWLDPLSRGGSLSPPFVAVLLAALMVFYLCALWTLERAGPLRLIVIGATAVGLFVAGLLPTFAPTPPPPWRSELALAATIAGLAGIAFMLAWRRVATVRDGDQQRALRIASLFGFVAEIAPRRRRAFTDARAAHFWLEWRSTGMVLPILVGLQFVLMIMPMSWRMRDSANDTAFLVLAALAAPVLIAVPLGMMFSKSTYWSEDLAIPSFIAVRPLSAEDIVAVKIRVAAASTVLAWLVTLAGLAIWLPAWGQLDTLSRLALQVWAFHEGSSAAVYAMTALVLLAGMFLTWRLHVSRLWSGLSGARPLLVASVVSTMAMVVAAVAFEIQSLPAWLLDDPSRLVPLAWIAAAAVIAKYWLAAYAWRRVPMRYLRAYLPIWLAGTVSCLALAIMLWGMVRIYLPADIERLRSVVILLALLAMPLARVGLAPAALSRNRHRA